MSEETLLKYVWHIDYFHRNLTNPHKADNRAQVILIKNTPEKPPLHSQLDLENSFKEFLSEALTQSITEVTSAEV